MKRLVLAAALSLVTAACGGGASGPSVADLEAAQGEVHGMQPVAEAEGKLTEKLGAPTAKSDTEWTWQAKDGEACKELKVTLMGDMVGGVSLGDCPT